MKKITKLNELGIASMMFTIFIVLILSLIAIGFAFISRNDQRQTLDKTLSNQATYAAESAINKIQSLFREGVLERPEWTSCQTDASVPSVNNFRNKISEALPSADIKITCLKWLSDLPQLVYDPVGSSPVVVPIFPTGDTGGLKITWQSKNGAKTDKTSATDSLTLRDNQIPTLRIAAAGEDTINRAGVVYLNPSTSGSGVSISYDAYASGLIANAACRDDDLCTVILNTGFFNGYLSIASLNGDSKVEISAKNGDSVKFNRAQARVDVTARSQDVFKRLIGYVPLNDTSWRPGFVASADTLCKNYRVDGNNRTAGPAGDLCPPLDEP